MGHRNGSNTQYYRQLKAEI